MSKASAWKYAVNANGGIYHPGREHNFETKLSLATTYWNLKDESNGEEPSVASVARAGGVGWDFTKKVIEELHTYGCPIPPEELAENHLRTKGVGSRSLTFDEEVYLLYLRFTDPHRKNQSYVNKLFETTGTVVSTSFISDWFKHRFEHKGNFKVPSLEPLDKYKPENVAAYHEYLVFRSTIQDPKRWKFIDEKGLRGFDLFSRKGRQDPVTGMMDTMPVDGDFRTAYNLIAAITCNPTKSPVMAVVGPDNGTSQSFMAFIEHLVASQWLEKNDVLVLDNWVGHTKSEAEYLGDLLWNIDGPDGNPMNILVKFLPTRSPELNPIELIFQTLVQRLKAVSLEHRPHHDAVLYFVNQILSSMDHELIIKTMIHDGY